MDGTESFERTWINHGLWIDGKSPAFGLYSGDIRGAGFVYAMDFTVTHDIYENDSEIKTSAVSRMNINVGEGRVMVKSKL